MTALSTPVNVVSDPSARDLHARFPDDKCPRHQVMKSLLPVGDPDHEEPDAKDCPRKQLAKVATRRLPETDPLVRGVGDHETEDQFAKSRLLR